MAQPSDEKITTEYIDRLFSASAPKAAPPAQDPPKMPDAPAKSPKRWILRILAAIALFAVGLLLGALLARDEAPAVTTTPPVTTLAMPVGLLPNYEAMSTAELAVIACQITRLSEYNHALSSTVLTPDIYAALALEYPVLSALQTRLDAVPILENIQATSGNMITASVAGSLVVYFKAFLLPSEDSIPWQWTQFENDLLTVFEHTKAFALISVYPDLTDSVVLSIGSKSYRIQNTDPQALQQDSNFWFVIESAQPDSLGESVISVTVNGIPLARVTDGTQVEIRSDLNGNGLIVYGYTPKIASIVITMYDLYAQPFEIRLTATPATLNNMQTKELVEASFQHIAFSSFLLTEDDLASYPLMANLLSREDLVPVLLQLADEEKGADPSRLAYYTDLLSHPLVQEKMTPDQQQAASALTAYLDPSVLPGTPALLSFGTPVSLSRYYVGDTPESLKNTPEEALSFWADICLRDVPIESGSSWYLETEYADGSGDGWLTVIPYYDIFGQTLCGWLVTGQQGDARSLRITLRDGDGTVLEARTLALTAGPEG